MAIQAGTKAKRIPRKTTFVEERQALKAPDIFYDTSGWKHSKVTLGGAFQTASNCTRTPDGPGNLIGGRLGPRNRPSLEVGPPQAGRGIVVPSFRSGSAQVCSPTGRVEASTIQV